MPIEPPSLPTISIPPDAFGDDPSLILQTISVESAVANLQSVNSFSQLLGSNARLLLQTVEADQQFQAARNTVRNQEVADANRLANDLQAGINNEQTAPNQAEIQAFLQSRGLPSDLSTPKGQQDAVNALQGYGVRVENNFASIDNPGIRARIATNTTLRDALNSADRVLDGPAAKITPADLEATVGRLGQTRTNLVSELVDQLQQLRVVSATSVEASRLNTRVSTQLVQAIEQLRQLSRSRTEDLEQDSRDEIIGLNAIAQELGSTNLSSLSQTEIANTADRFSSQLASLLSASLATAPTTIATAYAAENRANEAQLPATNNSSSRFRDPSRFI